MAVYYAFPGSGVVEWGRYGGDGTPNFDDCALCWEGPHNTAPPSFRTTGHNRIGPMITALSAYCCREEWRGTYYAARFSVGRHRQEIVSDVPYSCPICAARLAEEITSPYSPGLNEFFPSIHCLLNVRLRDSCARRGFLNNDQDKTTVIPFVGRSCSNCGLIGHYASTCTASKRHFDRIGIEIEGRYEESRLNELKSGAGQDGVTHCGDGSINEGDNTLAREFQTRPDALGPALRQLAKYYPDEADYSCGLHVHVSFKDITYFTQLATPQFAAYFREQWIRWGTENAIPAEHEFWDRLMGRNSYCQVNSEHHLLGNPYRVDRYMQLNFTAYEEHKTVECRLLPMFTQSALAYSAIQHLIWIYESWLSRPGVDDFLVVPTESTRPSSYDARYTSEVEMPEPRADVLAIVCEMPVFDPPPEGQRRVALTPGHYQALQAMGLIAA